MSKREARVHLTNAQHPISYDRNKYDLEREAGGLRIRQKNEKGPNFPDPWSAFYPWHRIWSVIETFDE